jgi:hypothetical protein
MIVSAANSPINPIQTAENLSIFTAILTPSKKCVILMGQGLQPLPRAGYFTSAMMKLAILAATLMTSSTRQKITPGVMPGGFFIDFMLYLLVLKIL